MTANLLISIGKTNGWIQNQSAAGGCLKRDEAYGNALFRGTAAVLSRIDKITGRNERNVIKNKFDGLKAETDGISRLPRSNRKH